MSKSLDVSKLEREVKAVYRDVAETPDGEFHFEMGQDLVERLGYDSDDLAYVPQAAIDSFAGVGYHFDLAALAPGESVLDLGSGSGMDAFVAAVRVTETGSVTGVDMTDEQLENARRLANEGMFHNVTIERGTIEDLPFDDASFDAVILNGVINLSASKDRVFEEAYRVLESGGRIALSDIISESQMPESIKSNADLWAACIGGAEQIDNYREMVERAGFDAVEIRENPQYRFVSDRATNACNEYGVKSISLRAEKR
ncbi:methyltransferase domain-containing protein [Natrarchaeobius oligotrophus]|uniref:Arsenite methyltransferase n=1 Tax=Natrarchaeobius chitinivorans TaxID=1679083 RepID=A0A3N6NSS7_NATCH|nr:methyltransferase domain-containing protein [Natrarchaeobius chitinivorans]RQH03343.1 methyltransferase domain-containing protein [Natrarchaeobius chitinivorans]